MTDTPRTDNAAGDGTTVPADFAADLERELAVMTDERDRAEHETGKAYIERDEARAMADDVQRWHDQQLDRAEKAEAEVERLRAALETAKWMLERDYIDDFKMAVIRKCEAALKETK
jgi:multidrug resistance efflux pump